MRCVTAVLLAFAFALPAAAQPAPAEVFARETRTVADGVHMIFKPAVADPPFEGNVLVVEQAEGLVVIDAGGSTASGEAIVAQIRRLSDKPVRFLVYTHYHGDHNLGAVALKAAWPGLTVISTAPTRRNMLGPPMAYVATYGKSYADLAAYAADQAVRPDLPQALRDGWARTATAGPAMARAYSNLTVTPADLTFSDRLTLADPERPVSLAFLGRGNTDGDAVAWLPTRKVLATGDLVVAPIPYAAHTYPGEWIETLRRLKAYDAAVIVPGHGEPMSDFAYVDRLISALADVRTQVAAQVAAGADLDATRKAVDLEAVRAAFAGDDPWLRNLIDAVFTADLVSNAWKEARGETVVQGKG